MYKTRADKVKAMLSVHKGKAPDFWALKGVSLEVHSGEALGIIGINGSGKSTFSNIISGIIPPTSGDLEIHGDVSIIAIGAGLKGELTGLQNIRVKALMSGMTNQEIDEIIQPVIDFADIGAFIDQPVKSYSSGMRSRLGFAIAVHQHPDILVVDEALSVGDSTFYEKCMEKMDEFKSEGKTIIFISHALAQVEQFCDKVLWMHYGDVREYGDTEEVLTHYRTFTGRFNNLSKKEKRAYQNEAKHKQAVFTLDDLYAREKAESSLPRPVSDAELKQLCARNSIGDPMSKTTWFFLIAMILAALALGTEMVRSPKPLKSALPAPTAVVQTIATETPSRPWKI